MSSTKRTPAVKFLTVKVLLSCFQHLCREEELFDADIPLCRANSLWRDLKKESFFCLFRKMRSWPAMAWKPSGDSALLRKSALSRAGRAGTTTWTWGSSASTSRLTTRPICSRNCLALKNLRL